MNGYKEIFKETKSVLFVVAHPDDVDVSFAGTIALLRKNNVECYFLVLTSGDLGGLKEKRESEQLKSLAIVNVPTQNIVFARMADGYIENDHKTISTVVNVIRLHRPEVVATFDPRPLVYKDKFVTHRDHRNCGQSTIDAVYPYAGVAKYCPELGASFQTTGLLLGDTTSPHVEVDITSVIGTKKQMLEAHASQWTTEIVESTIKDSYQNGIYTEMFAYYSVEW